MIRTRPGSGKPDVR